MRHEEVAVGPPHGPLVSCLMPRLVILSWVVWLLSPVNGDDLPGLEFHAGLQREMGSGVAQSSMKAWAS